MCNLTHPIQTLALPNMSNKEIKELSEKLRYGLEIAERRMLEEKALKGQCIVVCDSDNNIQYIPAKQAIKNAGTLRF